MMPDFSTENDATLTRNQIIEVDDSIESTKNTIPPQTIVTSNSGDAFLKLFSSVPHLEGALKVGIQKEKELKEKGNREREKLSFVNENIEKMKEEMVKMEDKMNHKLEKQQYERKIKDVEREITDTQENVEFFQKKINKRKREHQRYYIPPY